MAKTATPEQRKQIAELYRLYMADGLSQSESIKKLASNLGRSADGIREILKREGIELIPSRQSNKVFENKIEPQESIYPQAGEAEDAEFDAKWQSANGSATGPAKEPLNLVDFFTFDGCEDLLELADELQFQEIGRFSNQIESLSSDDFEIAPVEKPNLPKEKRIKLSKAQVELFATDIHFPYEEKTGWGLFLDVAKETQPDIIWLNGDILDGYAVAQWDKNPSTAHENNIQYEFDYTRGKLEELKEICPNAKYYFKEGNHETRLQRFLNKNAPALRYLKAITIPFNLELERLEMEWIDNNDKFKLAELWHFHGNEIGGGGVNVALAKLRKIMANCIFGHYHIEQSAIMRKYDGSPIGAWAIPSLCDFQQDYVHHAETWSNGFARVEYLPSGLFHVQPTQILTDGNRKICRVDGQWFEKEIA
jgi:predicted phosphodiesterase